MRLIEDASEVPVSIRWQCQYLKIKEHKLMLLFSYCQLGACDVQNIKCNILIGVLFGFVGGFFALYI